MGRLEKVVELRETIAESYPLGLAGVERLQVQVSSPVGADELGVPSYLKS
jgi:hypothetical protein